MTPSPRLDGKRVLVTQADAFMGPVLQQVFSAQGAEVLADTRAGADNDEQIRSSHRLGERRVDAYADVASVQLVQVVETVLEAKAAGDWQPPVLGETLQGLGRLRRPPATAGNDQRTLRFQ